MYQPGSFQAKEYSAWRHQHVDGAINMLNAFAFVGTPTGTSVLLDTIVHWNSNLLPQDSSNNSPTVMVLGSSTSEPDSLTLKLDSMSEPVETKEGL